MTEIEWQQQVTLEGEPASKARPRLGRGRVYTPAQTASAEDMWRWHLRRSGITEPIGDRAFAVRLRFHSALWTRKDIDNMIKLVLDACNGVVWEDDRQVVGIDAWLHRGASEPRTELAVTAVDQPLAPVISCATCGKEVPARVNRQRDGSDRVRRFCSATCSWEAKRETRTCPRCSGSFQAPRSSRQRFCSRSCSGTAGGAASTVTAEQFRKAVRLLALGASQTEAAKSVGVNRNALSRALANGNGR